jgi:small subunit ribosomal protein S20
MAKEPEKTKKVKVPTALKRDLQNEKKRIRNKSFKANVRTVIRGFEETLKKNDSEAAKEHLSKVYSVLDKGAKRGVFSKNKADRSKARLTAQVQKLA